MSEYKSDYFRNTKVFQAVAPPGGYPYVNFDRVLPARGPSAFVLFSLTAAMMSWGFYKMGQAADVRRANEKEKVLARRALIPLLQHEEDLRYLNELKTQKEKEAKVMANVHGWDVNENVYHSKRWVPPSSGQLA